MNVNPGQVVGEWGAQLGRGQTGTTRVRVAAVVRSLYQEADGLAFAMVSDGTSELQVIITRSRVGENAYNEAVAVPVGDLLTAQGVVTRTPRGMLSILAELVEL